MNFLCPACKTPLPVATPVVVACSQCGVEVDLTRVDTAPGQARLWPEVDLTGETLGTFKLVSRAGSGGMGTVYVAEGLTGRCAVKVLSPQLAADPALRERFRREAQALRKVQHPGVVHIIDEGSQNGFCWYAMEHVEGKDLRARIAEGPLPLPEVEALARQLLDALAAVHEAQLVHRDLKPGNILLSPGGARLCDFGIARFDGATTLTESAALLGSLRYMAPEQRAGVTTPKSDLYSLGLVLYEAATGGLPGERDMPGGRVGRLIEALLQASPQKRPADARAAAKLVALKPKRTVSTAVAAAAATVGMAIFATWAVIATQIEPNTTANTKPTPIAPPDAGAPAVAAVEQLPDAGAPVVERLPRVRGGAIYVGGFDEPAVRQLADARRSELERCYEAAPEEVTGSVTVRIALRGVAGVKGRAPALLRPMVLRASEGKPADVPRKAMKSKKAPPIELAPEPVVTISESTVANADLESCVLAAVRAWPLPEPQLRAKGGAIVLAWTFDRPTRDELAAETAAPLPPPPKPPVGTKLDVVRGIGTGKKPGKPPPKESTLDLADEPPTKAAKVERIDRVAPLLARYSRLTSPKGTGMTDEERAQLLESIDAAIGEIGEKPIDKYEMVQRSDLIALKKKLAPETPSPPK